MLLKIARQQAGWTQAELAVKAGVHQTTISALENGNIAEPAYRVVVLICRALSVDPETIDEFRVGDA